MPSKVCKGKRDFLCLTRVSDITTRDAVSRGPRRRIGKRKRRSLSVEENIKPGEEKKCEFRFEEVLLLMFRKYPRNPGSMNNRFHIFEFMGVSFVRPKASGGPRSPAMEFSHELSPQGGASKPAFTSSIFRHGESRYPKSSREWR